MGRKGVSKRKPSQTKSKPLAANDASGSVSSVMKSTESLPGKTVDAGKIVPFTKGGGKTASDEKKKKKRG